ncbi:MAG: hypothetical protein WKG07_42310 [Hymenobacter sp.]
MFGDSVTPNQHQLAREFLLLDNYYVSGKSSAEGHQWTDAAMVSDYVEKNMRAWFRSYPHVQEDALVYSPTGFIWNHAADHGHSVPHLRRGQPAPRGPQAELDRYLPELPGRPAAYSFTIPALFRGCGRCFRPLIRVRMSCA